jgi:phosphoserine aminotransferase
MGAGIIEISHRSKEFDAVLNRCDELLKELAGIPDNYKILYVHGGAHIVKVHEFALRCLHYKSGKHRRSCAKIENSSHCLISSCIVS